MASWCLDPFPLVVYFFPIPITPVVSKTSQLYKIDLVRNFKLSFIKECADSQKKSLLLQRVSIWNPQMLVSQLLNVLICFKVKPKTHCRNPLRNVFRLNTCFPLVFNRACTCKFHFTITAVPALHQHHLNFVCGTANVLSYTLISKRQSWRNSF